MVPVGRDADGTRFEDVFNQASHCGRGFSPDGRRFEAEAPPTKAARTYSSRV